MKDVVLLLVNRKAGVGHIVYAQLAKTFLSRPNSRMIITEGHQRVTRAARKFVASHKGPVLIIVGGGGGTMRAAVEGIMTHNRIPSRVSISALRMGSGNVLAKQFDVPRDPVEGLSTILHNADKGVRSRCCIMRIKGEKKTVFGLTLGGFGAFGKVPGDLARWHARHPSFHKVSAYLLGIENLTTVEYGAALLRRSFAAAFKPATCDNVSVNGGAPITLLGGALLNFPLRSLPFKPKLEAAEPALSLHLIPLRRWLAPLLTIAPMLVARNARTYRITPEDTVRLTFAHPTEFFLDEDPLKTKKSIVISVAGLINFVPGEVA